MSRKMGQTSSEPIQTNPIKALKTFIKMELEGKKIGTSNDFNSQTGEIKTNDVTLLSSNEDKHLCKELIYL